MSASPKPEEKKVDAKAADAKAAEAKAAEAPKDPYKPRDLGLESHVVTPGHFEAPKHFYERVLNAQIHPMVASFVRLGNKRIAARYCHLHPKTNYDALLKILESKPRYFRWAGSDLFNVTNEKSRRQMVVIETNSCPSGQKSMPLLSDDDDSDGYHTLMRTTFYQLVQENAKNLPEGRLAVIFDKNPMEATGYAAALADVFQEEILVAEYFDYDTNPPVQWKDGVLHVRNEKKEWIPIRACFRYVTQRPWDRFPLQSKTLVMNPIIACLAGGRNKLTADKAYEFYNAEIAQFGLEIRTPVTIRNVTKREVPLWVKTMGDHAVIKVPYSNAGQGVYTITNQQELKEFMETDHRYEKFIVQSLIGNSAWSSVTTHGQFFHTGTIPNKKGDTFISDLRMMVGAADKGFQPLAVYARRALKPLVAQLQGNLNESWEMLGTNLSVKLPNGKWSTETNRLMLMDRMDFNQLGIGVDDLIDGYIQTCLCVKAIDSLCERLMEKGVFNIDLYKDLNQDDVLIREIKT